jgi:chromosome segregation ATPase
MTPKAARVFYVTHPTLEANLLKFQQACANSEQTIVLGCYRVGLGGDSRLFIRKIDDPRLEGVEQVTAAHEMLHSAYDRLRGSEKTRIDALLLDYFNNQLDDQRIKDTIENYKKTEPTELVNEMHSIFATEIKELPQELEDYYKQYFYDRSVVTNLAANYEGEFVNRKNQIAEIDQKLNNLKSQIDTIEKDLNQQSRTLQAQRTRIENSGTQAEVNAFNAAVGEYNALVRQYQNLLVEYNSLIEQRNTIAKELDSLQQSIDSRITTQPTQ